MHCFFFNFSILSIIENTKTLDFLMDGVKKMPQEHSTVPLYLFSGLFLLELQASKSGKCLITGVALCRLRWNLVMYGSNSHKMCLYDEKTLATVETRAASGGWMGMGPWGMLTGIQK
jgi:Na+/H+ antiporter NhaC